MLIEFSVSNFRSFRERQTLSMAAAPGLGKESTVFAAPVDGEELPDLLKVAAVYGPNASGKSNLLRALQALSSIAKLEPRAQPVPLPVDPFRFDTALVNQPSRFEVHFVENRTRYAFTLAATAERIVEERLSVFPNGDEQLLYHRTLEGYVYGDALEGKALHETWSQATNPQVLFLSRAVANSSEEIQQLRHPHRWLTQSMHVILGDMDAWQQIAQKFLEHSPELAPHVLNVLNDNDIPITDIRSDLDLPLTTPLAREVQRLFANKRRTTLTHKTALGEAQFDFNEESQGTKNLFGFALPWISFSSESTATKVLAIDEFDSSLHPNIVATMVRKHIESDTTRQLIFTTHDTHLMTTKLLRRDQFWLTERDANGATQLRSIHDFEGSEDEDLEKRYFEGRYRALPLVRRG